VIDASINFVLVCARHDRAQCSPHGLKLSAGPMFQHGAFLFGIPSLAPAGKGIPRTHPGAFFSDGIERGADEIPDRLLVRVRQLQSVRLPTREQPKVAIRYRILASRDRPCHRRRL